jgi:hypothetical protein
MNVPLPASALGNLLNDPALARYAIALDYPIAINLASDEECREEFQASDHQVLSESDRQDISQLLTNNTKRNAVLFVLDTGWPSNDAYTNSLQEFRIILDSFWRQHFNLGLSSAPYPNQYTEPSNFHCRCIERALREFRHMDQGQHVKVIYVPLTQEQAGKSILEDLLQTLYLYEWEEGEQLTPPSDALAASRKYAEETVSDKIPTQWSGEQVTTDKALLDAIILLSDEYADKQETFLFVNESWTVSHKEYYLRWPLPLHGAVLAAAGNGGVNVSSTQLDFADRSNLAKDTIAIMNMDPKLGFVCSSSFIDKLDIDTAMAIAYDGKISEDICGTSFAAPRVAWLLAADEALRRNPIEAQRWSSGLQERLASIRDPNAKQYLKLWLSPGKLLALPH